MTSRFVAWVLSCAAALAFIGCGDSDPGGGSPTESGGDSLRITGTLAGTKGAAGAPGGMLQTCDQVYAVNTGYNGDRMERILAPIEGGAFSLELSKTGSWVLVFIDSTQTGAAMIQGMFKAEDLDSIAPMSRSPASESDLGEIEVDPLAQTATLDQTHFGRFLEDLGYTEANAAFFGALDDLMLRYVNPDVDGNGIIDMKDPDLPDYRFRYSNDYALGDSALHRANLQRVRAGEALSTDAPITFSSAYLFIQGGKQSAGVIPFFQSKTQFRLTVEHAGSRVYQSRVKSVFDNGAEFAYGISSGSDGFDPTDGKLPEGTYLFDFYNAAGQKEATFTFAHVNTRDNVDDIDGFVFPFPVFRVDDSDTITAIDYHWMKSTPQGLVDATPEELELLLGGFPASIGWHTECSNPNDCGVWVLLNPREEKYAITGSVPASRITGGAQNTRKRKDIINVNVSFSTKIGIGIGLSVAQ